MGAYDTPLEKCPYCGTDCEADWVDVGVGMVQCGPYYCQECRASEIGSCDDIGFDRELYHNWRKENYKLIKVGDRYEDVFIGKGETKFILPETATITQDEWEIGWYKPNSPMGSSVNTCNGEYVDHKTAKELYDKGLLDEKKGF